MSCRCNELAEGRQAAALVSQHLAKLRLARLVTTRREGSQVFYRLANEHVAQLVPTRSTTPSTPAPASPAPPARRDAQQRRRLWEPPRGDHATTTNTATTSRGPPGLRSPHVFGPHSHDAADSVDCALEASAEGIRALKISLVVLAVTALAQLVVVAVTGSVALLADTIHNFSDALTAVPLWIAFVARPPGREPPLHLRLRPGRGPRRPVHRAMIALSAVVAGYESVRRLIDPQRSSTSWVVSPPASSASSATSSSPSTASGSAARSARRRWSPTACTPAPTASRRWRSSSARSACWPASRSADPIVGLLITVAILVVLRGAARDIYRRLMDAVDPELIEQAAEVVRAPGVVEVEHVRLRWIGHRVFAEVAVVAADLDLVSAHAIATRRAPAAARRPQGLRCRRPREPGVPPRSATTIKTGPITSRSHRDQRNGRPHHRRTPHPAGCGRPVPSSRQPTSAADDAAATAQPGR